MLEYGDEFWELKILAMTQTPLKDYHQTIVWKTPKEYYDNI